MRVLWDTSLYMIIILQYHYTLSIKVIYKHIDILYLCCSHAYFLDLVLIKHESQKSDTEPLKLHNAFFLVNIMFQSHLHLKFC
jgi:hypothetical protein